MQRGLDFGTAATLLLCLVERIIFSGGVVKRTMGMADGTFFWINLSLMISFDENNF